MQLADFDFDLPPDLIALRPAEPRDAARLLVVRVGGALEDRVFSDLPDLLRPGDALVLNDTRDCGEAVRAAGAGRDGGGRRGDAS
jgi:S-adenosylmethionine:tRNA ribosyltransferase-isomerase